VVSFEILGAHRTIIIGRVRRHQKGIGTASDSGEEFDEAVSELRYALDVLGADGIVRESNQRGVYLGDERLEPSGSAPR
jgi:hypothetical protein